MPSFERTVVAPEWGDSIASHLGYLCWHLENHPDVLETLFALLDDHQKRKPGRQFSVSDAFAVMRWKGDGVSDDIFAMNNNLLACFSRIYVNERPAAKKLIDVRRSWLDSLDAAGWHQIRVALARGRATLGRLDGLW